MKSIDELVALTVNEAYANKIENDASELYLNNSLGDISFLIAAIIGFLMQQEADEWESRKWCDDTLITNFSINEDVIVCKGILIWGILDDTMQWTDPFEIEISVIDKRYNRFALILFFKDVYKTSITYEEYSINRHYWDFSSIDWVHKIHFGI
ncbi:MAG: hypothetical protein J0L80_08920 [Chitinophagales bacterium]|nr:hypothetical protein [Chitinophagales bacterium]